MTERLILDADDLRRALTRIAHEIVERVRAACPLHGGSPP